MKILIRLPNWLGDVVMSTAFVAAARQLYPTARIDVIIKSELSELTSLMPGLTTIHSFSKQEYKGLGGAYRFGKKLRAEKYDLFYVLPDSISAAVMGWATGAKQRVGYSKEGGFFLLTKVCKRPKNVHRVDEYIAILEQFTGKTIIDKQVKLDIPAQPLNNLILVNFNSEAESRRMPPGKGINMLNQLINAFKKNTFAFIGSPKDTGYVDQFIINADSTHQLVNYAGKTNLTELVKLMAGAEVLLTTDSGPAHLANSVGVPVIVLFGAGNEYNTAPYNKTNLTVIRANRLDCEPCLRNTCELYGLPKCIKLLDERKIINALNLYLNHA